MTLPTKAAQAMKYSNQEHHDDECYDGVIE